MTVHAPEGQKIEMSIQTERLTITIRQVEMLLSVGPGLEVVEIQSSWSSAAPSRALLLDR